MLHKFLQTFKTIGLDALNKNLLLTNREDRKYIFPINQLEKVLLKCNENYAILEIADSRLFDYRNTYYDTKDLSMYHQYQRGKKIDASCDIEFISKRMMLILKLRPTTTKTRQQKKDAKRKASIMRWN